jgi:hypothetical protein
MVKKALRTGGEPFEYRRERQPRPHPAAGTGEGGFK